MSIGRTEAVFGSWSSPITADMLVSGAKGINEVIPDGSSVWWAESRPEEGGRVAIMCWQDDSTTEVSPPSANVRTLMHEYGGGSWWVENGVLWYVDYSDQRLWEIKNGQAPVALTAEPETPKSQRYADIRPTACKQWLVVVKERHSQSSDEPENLIAAVAADGSQRQFDLSVGADFYASPALSPDGKQLAWVEWDHPNMPWDDTRLMLADIELAESAIKLTNTRRIAGGQDEAITQPEWSPDGTLHYLSDRSDLWQLYAHGADAPVIEADGDIGYPPWVHGLSRYCFKEDGTPVFAFYKNGIDHLNGFPQQTSFNTVRSSGDKVSFASASWQDETRVTFDGKDVLLPRTLPLQPDYLASPVVINFPTAKNGKETANALFYAPANPDFVGPGDQRPPLIVLAHGGPTAPAKSQLALAIRFWTSRGFAVVDVNYRGSSGFGRAYRKKLEKQWGIVDVEDCVAAAQYLVARDLVDPDRLIIRGGSAGGFTVLSALAFHDVFTAGASLYGVADLEALANDTHKFESRYLDNLIGKWPDDAEIYAERSPINHLEGFKAPMIILQGSDDAIVPPNQSRMIFNALDERNVPVAYIEYEGEQHGFRQASTIIHSLQSELTFYGRIFDFVPASDTTELEIKNLA